MNIFGRTGNYGHIILKKHDKPKKKIYEKDEMFDDGLPRLILVSGRSDDGVRQTIRLVRSTLIQIRACIHLLQQYRIASFVSDRKLQCGRRIRVVTAQSIFEKY